MDAPSQLLRNSLIGCLIRLLHGHCPSIVVCNTIVVLIGCPPPDLYIIEGQSRFREREVLIFFFFLLTVMLVTSK